MYIIPAPQPPPPPLWPTFAGDGGFSAYNGTDGGGGDLDPDLPSNWSSLIGIVTAIVGNVLIALALNVQRYAHIKLHQRRQRNRERARQALKDAAAANGHNGQNGQARHGGQDGQAKPNGGGRTGGGSYGALDGEPRNGNENGNGNGNDNSGGSSSRNDTGRYRDNENEDDDDGNGADAHESDPLTASYRSGDSRWSEGSDGSDGRKSPKASSSSTSYLRSPYWWLGQVLITVGEMGNFLAYGFAPASIVSPLGVVALISNCVIAPILFKERFRPRDFWGVVVAIAGAVTVVLSAKQEETKLNPHDVWDAITTTAFEIYLGITWALIALLMWASPRYGNRTILIDLGLVGLFGAYTVLATKGVSSMLSSTLLGAFATPMTYALIVVLLATAVMQVRYVNKALQRFDSTQVIPIQFVMFTLSVIIGSAVLYRDFERTTAEQAVKFVGGCLLTFFGVFIITSGRPPVDDDEEDDNLSIPDGTEGERINLAEQAQHESGAPQTPTGRPASTIRTGSRRSSRASRVNFGDAINNRPLSSLFTADTGVPSQRTPSVAVPPLAPAAIPRISAPSPTSDDNNPIYRDDEDGEESIAGGEEPSQPLLENPWRSTSSYSTPVASSPLNLDLAAATPTPQRPGLFGPAHYSADDVLHGVASGSGPSAGSPAAPITSSPAPPPPGADRPVTPVTPNTATLRPHAVTPHYYHHHHHHHHPSPMISPSPLLSSTVSTVVADTILKQLDGGSSLPPGRRLSTRRTRPGSLRSSLFVPQDELLLDDAERLLQPFAGQQQQQLHHRQSQQRLLPQHHRGSSTDALVSRPGPPASSQPESAPSASGNVGSSNRSSSKDERSGGGLRGRARSLSTTLGGLFWSRRKHSNANADAEEGHAGSSTIHDEAPPHSDYTANDDIPPAAASDRPEDAS